MAAPPQFRGDDKPAYIVNAAGTWLAQELGGGCRWVPSARALKVPIAPGRTGEVQLRPSHWNYTGVLTHALIQVVVRDRALATWRRKLGYKRTGIMVDRSPDTVWGTQIVNIYPDLHDVELFGDVAAATGSRNRYLTLPELLAGIRDRILPKLLMFDSPVRAARELPDVWLAEPGPMVEWATCLGDEDSARLIVTRADKMLRRLPPDSELESVLASGRELLEKLQSELHHFREYRDGNLADDLLREGIDLTRRWIDQLSDPVGRSARIPDGALTRWAASNLGPVSPIRQKAIDFEAAAMPIRAKAVI